MSKKSWRNLAVAGMSAGVLTLVPSLASAFHGNMVACTMSSGIGTVVTFSPGLTCDDLKAKISVSASVKAGNVIDNCAANLAAPWAAWAAAKYAPPGVSAPGSIAKAAISVKASTFGSCNFGGDANSSGAAGAGKFTFLDAAGLPVPGAKGNFFARVAGSTATFSATALGVVTKGPVPGALLEVNLSLDLGGVDNAPWIGCNTGLLCPPNDIFPNKSCTGAGTPAGCCTAAKTGTCTAPLTRLDLKTDAACTGVGAPAPCCTGAGTGSCDFLRLALPDNADCTALGAPLHCCTGAGTGTCS